jgi:molybdopterin synthase catalytic subunit
MLYALTDSAIDVEAVVRAVRSDAMGGLVTFVGYVRERSDDDRSVTGLSYEAHRDLALGELRAIGVEASEKFGPARVAIVHRLGALSLGEAAVAIAVASAHRATAFDACEYAIDELKKRVAIFKKEHYTGGDASWRENVSPLP